MKGLFVHYLAPEFVNAKRLERAEIKSRLKAGWIWYKLEPGFSAIGGIAHYRRALVNPASSELGFVSDFHDGPDRDSLPAINTSFALVELDVPFAEKDVAKALGAVWIHSRKKWACAPLDMSKFDKWVGEHPVSFDLLEAPNPK